MGNQKPKAKNHGIKNQRELTHLDAEGRAKMVDVTGKSVTAREAVARAKVVMSPQTLKLVQEGQLKKGNVFAVARVAGIMAAKKTHELIPMCHPLQITGVEIDFNIDEENSSIGIEATVRTMDRTGVEMEALIAVSIAALTIYDMCKAVERGITITEIYLVKKSGGKSGVYERK